MRKGCTTLGLFSLELNSWKDPSGRKSLWGTLSSSSFRYSREAAQPPSVKVFKIQLHKVVSNLLWNY